MDDINDAEEFYAERAAILEYEAGLKRHAAEYQAIVATHAYCQRTGNDPPRDAQYHFIARSLTQRELPIFRHGYYSAKNTS